MWTILSGRPSHEQLMEKFVARLGGPVHGLPSGLTHSFPDATAVTPVGLALAGLPEAEAAAIALLAATVSAGRKVRTDPGQWRLWLALAAAHLMAHEDGLHDATVLA